jgi:glycyl-tRNA synthetase
MGPVEDATNIVYMRPETAQGIYVNFQNVQQTMRQKLPMGIAQIGKAFRNEITPGNFIFRTREFEQMEMQFFVAPEEDEKWFNHWMETRLNWHKSLGIKPENLRFHEHGKGELAHYAKKAFDIEYNFPIGWNEVEGIHNRTDFDLNRHQQFSGKRLEYIDEVNKRRYIPYIIETSAGCDRTLLMTLCDAYYEEKDEKGEERVVMRFDPKLAPTSLAIFPLMKKDGLGEFADKLYADFRKKYRTDYDASGSIGRRYRRQDEVGTPLCLTVDYDSIKNNDVTVRHRDKMTQERVSLSNLSKYIEEKMANFNS